MTSRSQGVTFRLADPLLEELKSEAADEGLELSELIRTFFIAHTARRMARRTKAA